MERGSWPVKPGIRYKKSCGFNVAWGRYPVLCLLLGARARLAGCMMWGIEHGRRDRREAEEGGRPEFRRDSGFVPHVLCCTWCTWCTCCLRSCQSLHLIHLIHL